MRFGLATLVLCLAALLAAPAPELPPDLGRASDAIIAAADAGRL